MRRTTTNRRALGAFVLAVAAWGGAAKANGAFPDEFSVHLPADAPHRIFMGTNFGLVVSEDDGASWRYACEPYVVGAISNAILYQLAPDGTMFAASLGGLTRSSDRGCTWSRSGGMVAALSINDFFVDPNDATFILAIASSASGSGIYSSHDGGSTFGAALYTTADQLNGVEIARSERGVVYATAAGSKVTLLRSADFGTNWTPTDLNLPAGTIARLAAVDPADANIVYLRLITSTTDSIAITTDGGKTVQPPAVRLSGTVFSSFLRAEDGTLYAGSPGGDLYVRATGSTAFSRRGGPHMRCLGQRPGSVQVFACGDAFLDGFNLGYSDDAAQSFQPLALFPEGGPPVTFQLRGAVSPRVTTPARLSGLLNCPQVQAACAAHWAALQQTLGITSADAGGSQSGGGTSTKSSSCGSAGVSEIAVIVLLAFALRQRRADRRPVMVDDACSR
jgi:hypothetical protein